MKVVVIGAGVVGATTALCLAERGVEVTLIERHSLPAAETSHANGGGITPGHAEPWNTPGIARRVLTRSGSSEPFRIYPRALPGLMGWGLSFLRGSTPKRYFPSARNCTRLAVYSGKCLARLREAHSLDYHQYTRGSLELYFSQAELDQAHSLRRKIGNPEVDLKTITPDEAVSMEPALEPVAGQIHGAMLFSRHESGDACEFSRLAAQRAESLGARVMFNTRLQSIELEKGQFREVFTDQGPIGADALVLAAGCTSPELTRPLGLKLPIYPVKGYSATLELENADHAPVMPLLDLEKRIVTARFGNRLRMAGLADFEGFDRTVREDRIAWLLDSASNLLPRLAEEIKSGRAETWAGLRPMTPDGAPLLGQSRIEGIWLNTGHGSMGWTEAAGSAQITADLLTGKPPAIDLAGLTPDRWKL